MSGFKTTTIAQPVVQPVVQTQTDSETRATQASSTLFRAPHQALQRTQHFGANPHIRPRRLAQFNPSRRTGCMIPAALTKTPKRPVGCSDRLR